MFMVNMEWKEDLDELCLVMDCKIFEWYFVFLGDR